MRQNQARGEKRKLTGAAGYPVATAVTFSFVKHALLHERRAVEGPAVNGSLLVF